jgi:hypothetical protein
MKSATLVSFIALALLLGTPCLGAQPNGQGPQRITVDVPVDFMVGRIMFPAGNYIVKPLGDRTFRLQAGRGRESVKFVTESIRTPGHPITASLVFSKENGHYQLRELWMNAAIGEKIPGAPAPLLRTVRESRLEVPAKCAVCK